MASPQRSLSLSVLLLLVSVSWGLRVERTDSPSVWVLRTGDDDALRSIVSSTFAQIYVLYAPSSDATALATVRFQGGYPPQTRRSSGLSSPSPGSLRISSRSAVEVTVHVKEQLHHIQTTSYGSIVIDHDVLVSDDSTAIVTAVASSTGSVYLPPHVRLHVSSLSLQSRSYGSVFLVASDIAVDSLDLQVRSTGSAKLHADSITVKGTVSVGVESFGSASLSAVSLHATQLDVTTTSTGAAGVIATREDSTVEQCHLKQLSFGEIQAGSVVCTNAIVENDGYNCVVVRVSDSLVYSSSSFGHVYYTGARPKTIMSTSEQESPHSVEPAEGSADAPAEPKWAVTYTLPPHKPFDHSSLESLQVRGSESLDLRTNASTYEFPWLFLGVAVIAAVVYGVKRTASPRRQRERRNENAPLLKDNVPASV